MKTALAMSLIILIPSCGGSGGGGGKSSSPAFSSTDIDGTWTLSIIFDGGSIIEESSIQFAAFGDTVELVTWEDDVGNPLWPGPTFQNPSVTFGSDGNFVFAIDYEDYFFAPTDRFGTLTFEGLMNNSKNLVSGTATDQGTDISGGGSEPYTTVEAFDLQ